MEGLNVILAATLAASLLAGVLISVVMSFSAGPHREPLWLAAVISTGSGATITAVAHVLAEASSLSIWQVMALGAGCGALGVLGYSLSVTPRNPRASSTRNSDRKNRVGFRSAREPWRVPRAGCRAVFSTPDFQKRKLSDRGQEAAQQ